MTKSNVIVVTGPESVGKTVLCQELSSYYKVSWVPEYARNYVEQLQNDYTYSDVEHIAHQQIKQFNELGVEARDLLFFDTDLIVTKVWFDLKYGKCPVFVTDALETMEIGHVLLCEPDLPWVDDPVRENGGAMRQKLFDIYKNELRAFKISFSTISGIGTLRKANAIQALSKQGF